MFSAEVRPLKTSWTLCIDQKIGAMGRLIKKFGLYAMDLQNVITETHSSKDRSTVEGKFKKMFDAKVLPRCALFKDVLADAKIFRLLMQNQNKDILKISEAIESTKNSYHHLRKKLEKNPEHVFQLLTLKMVIEEIEANTEDGEPLNQTRKSIIILERSSLVRINV